MADIDENAFQRTLSVAIKYQKNEESILYRLKKKTVLHIVPSDSLLGKHIAILTNYPSNEKGPFVRGEFASETSLKKPLYKKSYHKFQTNISA
jgi:hypothetical protein